MSEEKGAKGKIIWIIVAIVVVAAAAAVGGYFFYQEKAKEEKRQMLEVSIIYPGISVEGIDVGGLSKEEATDKLNQELSKQIAENQVVFRHEDNSWTYGFDKFEMNFDVDKAVEDAYAIGRTGTEDERLQAITALETSPVNVAADCQYSQESCQQVIEALKQEINIEPVNATMERKDGSFIITEEQIGYTLDEEDALDALNHLLEAKKSGEITLQSSDTEPAVTKAQLEEAQDLIGSYSTSFSGGQTGRNENLRVGCENINGTLLLPGETFSMNEGLGPQTYENGYRNAAVIVNGKIEDGLAGGVCQITTTLYNAVILAELEVVERHNHSLMVSYVPLGMDAAVAGDYKDLKFKNDTDYPVYIEAYISDNHIYTNVYGHEIHDPGHTVEFERVYEGTIQKPPEKVTEDPTRPEGEREVTYTGKTGAHVSTYKKVYENGELVSRELFSKSTYSATADEVIVGTKPVEDATTPASTTDDDYVIGEDSGTPADSVPVIGQNTNETANETQNSEELQTAGDMETTEEPAV